MMIMMQLLQKVIDHRIIITHAGVEDAAVLCKEN